MMSISRQITINQLILPGHNTHMYTLGCLTLYHLREDIGNASRTREQTINNSYFGKHNNSLNFRSYLVQSLCFFVVLFERSGNNYQAISKQVIRPGEISNYFVFYILHQNMEKVSVPKEYYFHILYPLIFVILSLIILIMKWGRYI